MTVSPFMTRAEAADFCHVSVDSFDAHVRPLLPPPKRVGRRILFLRSDLEAWAEDYRSAPSTERGGPSPRTHIVSGASSAEGKRIAARLELRLSRAHGSDSP
jgi:hypothetical protein